MSTPVDTSVYMAQLYYRDGAGALVAYPGTTFAQQDTMTGSTHPVLPNTYFEGLLKKAVIEEWGWAPNGTRGPRQVASGSIVLLNLSGDQDAWSSRNVHLGRCLLHQVYEGLTSAELDFRGYIETAKVGNDDVTFTLRDDALLLEKPVLSNTYAGTNVLPAGIEGGDDIKGMKKPEVLGIFYGFSPVLVNTSGYIYQVDGGRGFATGWSLVVKDQGVGLTQGADYVSQVDMETTPPAAGTFRVWPAGGCFRLSGKPTGQVTCDGANPVPTTYASPTGGSPSATQHIIGYLYRKAFPSGTTVLSNLGGVTMPDAGMVISGDETILQAINRIAEGAGCGFRFTFNGSTDFSSASLNFLTLYKVFAPNAYVSGSLTELNETNIHAPDGKTTLRKIDTSDPDMGVPVWRVNVRYARNHTVQTPDQLGAAVAIADVQFAGSEWRVTSQSDASILTAWPNAAEITIDSCYAAEVDAYNLAGHLLTIYKVQRQMFSCDVPINNFAYPVTASSFGTFRLSPGQNANLKHPRFGLSAGKGVMCVGRRVDVERGLMTLFLWG